jgi:hypothetical protein
MEISRLIECEVAPENFGIAVFPGFQSVQSRYNLDLTLISLRSQSSGCLWPIGHFEYPLLYKEDRALLSSLTIPSI